MSDSTFSIGPRTDPHCVEICMGPIHLCLGQIGHDLNHVGLGQAASNPA